MTKGSPEKHHQRRLNIYINLLDINKNTFIPTNEILAHHACMNLSVIKTTQIFLLLPKCVSV